MMGAGFAITENGEGRGRRKAWLTAFLLLVFLKNIAQFIDGVPLQDGLRGRGMALDDDFRACLHIDGGDLDNRPDLGKLEKNFHPAIAL